MNCPQCSTKNPDDFVFCLQCGERLDPPRSEREDQMAPADQVAPTLAEPIPPPSAFLGPPSGARLSVEQGSVDQREFTLEKPAISIGRRQGNDIVVHDTNVSRQHARVIQENGGFVVEDCNSANGTLVNEERVEGKRRLRSGDAIKIGDAVFVFEEGQGDEPQVGMTTVAMEMDSPMTTIGAPLDVEPPAALASHAPSPVGPLTPPPAIMEPVDQAPPEATIAAEQFPVAPEPVPPPERQRKPKPAATAPEPAVPRLAAIQRDLSDLSRDLGSFATSVAGLVARVEQLERALAEAGSELGQLAEAARGPAAEPLRGMGGLISDAEAAGGPERLDPAIELLQQLAAQPRDIELLLKLSQQAAMLDDVLRLHLRLVAAGPKLSEALARVLGPAPE